MKSRLACALLGLLACGIPRLQGSDPTRNIRGQLVQAGVIIPPGLTVSVHDMGSPSTAAEAPVLADGSFELPALENGQYEIRITNDRGELIHREFVDIGVNRGPLMLRMHTSDQGTATPSLPGTISAQRLLHKVPSKAAKEYRASLKASEAGDREKCIQHLQRAIEIDPEYMEAHNNLGVQYIALEQYEQAAAELEKCVSLDPTSVRGQLNLSVALGMLQRYADAEAAARRAVRLDSRFIPARYLLGRLLVIQDKNTPEAVESLRMSSQQYPNARLALAHVLVRRGAVPEAVAELQAYLNSEQAERKQEVEAWLAQLTH